MTPSTKTQNGFQPQAQKSIPPFSRAENLPQEGEDVGHVSIQPAPQSVDKIALGKQLGFTGSEGVIKTNVEMLISDLGLPEVKGSFVSRETADRLIANHKQYSQQKQQHPEVVALPPTPSEESLVEVSQQPTTNTAVTAPQEASQSEGYGLTEAVGQIQKYLGYEPSLAEISKHLLSMNRASFTDQEIQAVALNINMARYKQEFDQIENSLNDATDELAIKSAAQRGQNRAVSSYLAARTAHSATLKALMLADLITNAQGLQQQIEADPLKSISEKLNIPLPQLQIQQSEEEIKKLMTSSREVVTLTQKAITPSS